MYIYKNPNMNRTIKKKKRKLLKIECVVIDYSLKTLAFYGGVSSKDCQNYKSGLSFDTNN